MIGGAEGISPVAPVDLAQAAIGPGMEVFSKYTAVLEADGSAMTVHTALLQINRALAEGGDDFDADTRFCLGCLMNTAGVLATVKQMYCLCQGTSLAVLSMRGLWNPAAARCLMKPDEYPIDWDPEHDQRLPVWEVCHHLIRVLSQQGETEAGHHLGPRPRKSRVHSRLGLPTVYLCERKAGPKACSHNELITSWPLIKCLA